MSPAGRMPARSWRCRTPLPNASPGSIASWWPAMNVPRPTSTPRARKTYSCESRPDLVVDPHRRDHDAELAGDLAADRGHPRTSVPPPRRSTSGTRPKPTPSSSGSSGSSLEHLLGRRPAVSGSAARPRAWRRPAPASRAARCAPPADRREHAADEQEREGGQPRHEPEQRDRAAGDQRRLRWRGSGGDLLAEIPVGGRAGDDDAGGDRDQQRRDLGGQAVADRQQRVGLGGVAEAQVVLERRRPPCRRSRLIAVIMTAAMASPLTNFEAPSIAP